MRTDERKFLEGLIQQWEQAAAEARKKGDRREPGVPPEYCYGYSYGLEEAAEQLKELIQNLAGGEQGVPYEH